jgi:ABC-type sugar transport system substrate-binding protein
MVTTVVACGDDSDSNASSGSDSSGESSDLSGKTIGILEYIRAVEGVRRPSDATKEAAESIGWTVETTDAQADPKKFVSGMQQFISKGVNGIAIMWIPAEAIAPQLEEAGNADIAVADMLSGPSDLEPWNDVSYDPEALAKLSVEGIVGQIGESGEIYGIIDDTVTNPRLQWAAVKEILAKDYPNIKVVGEHQSDNANLATDISGAVTSAIQKYPDLKLVWTVADAQATPALAAIEQAGKTDDIALVSSNGNSDVLDAIRAGRPVSTVAIGFEEGGYQVVNALLASMAGNELSKSDTTLSLELITKDNVPPKGESFEGTPGFAETYAKKWKSEYGL